MCYNAKPVDDASELTGREKAQKADALVSDILGDDLLLDVERMGSLIESLITRCIVNSQDSQNVCAEISLLLKCSYGIGKLDGLGAARQLLPVKSSEVLSLSELHGCLTEKEAAILQCLMSIAQG
ncbi:MAG: hypothetical protein EOO38_11120 [Cytophagaceae bacterium]|nr:MAG: hypothetical protein EOO38_11120 [Cytophagaceae bacterium]